MAERGEQTQDARGLRSLSAAFAVWRRRRSPRILMTYSAALIVARVALVIHDGLASLGWIDLALALGILLVLWPVQEWFLHQYVLHLRPMEIAGRRVDPEFAQRHRAHHREPWDIDAILLPPGLVLRLTLPALALWWLVTPTLGLCLTAAASYAVAATAYEWIHYLTHTGVAPKSAWFRRVRRNHRYHHYKNERYWHGFCVPLVDTLFGTNPSVRDVETSSTARTLGVDDPEHDEGA